MITDRNAVQMRTILEAIRDASGKRRMHDFCDQQVRTLPYP